MEANLLKEHGDNMPIRLNSLVEGHGYPYSVHTACGLPSRCRR